MRAVVVNESMHRNTHRVAESIAEGLGGHLTRSLSCRWQNQK